MPVPLPSSTLDEIRSPLPIVRRLLAEGSATSNGGNVAVSEYFKAALDGKWDQVKERSPKMCCLPCRIKLV